MSVRNSGSGMAAPGLGVHVRERDVDLIRDRQEQPVGPDSATDSRGNDDTLCPPSM